jgi:hypothetical protein
MTLSVTASTFQNLGSQTKVELDWFFSVPTSLSRFWGALPPLRRLFLRVSSACFMSMPARFQSSLVLSLRFHLVLSLSTYRKSLVSPQLWSEPSSLRLCRWTSLGVLVPKSGESCSLQFVILPHDFSQYSSVTLSVGCLQHETRRSLSLLPGIVVFNIFDSFVAGRLL